MKTWHMYALILGLSSLLAACSTTNPNVLAVTVYSQPEGAMLYEASKALGMTPYRLNYQLTPALKQAGIVNAKPITAVWPSGARETYSMKYQLSTGLNQYYTISRPQDAPGLEQDLAHAANLQAHRASTNANSDAEAALMLFNSLLEGYNSGSSESRYKSYYPATNQNEIRCTSQKIGNQIYTDCK